MKWMNKVLKPTIIDLNEPEKSPKKRIKKIVTKSAEEIANQNKKQVMKEQV